MSAFAVTAGPNRSPFPLHQLTILADGAAQKFNTTEFDKTESR
jgi:hypothetical protein